MYVYIYTQVYVRIHIYKYIYIYVHVCVYTCIQVMYVHAYVSNSTYTLFAYILQQNIPCSTHGSSSTAKVATTFAASFLPLFCSRPSPSMESCPPCARPASFCMLTLPVAFTPTSDCFLPRFFTSAALHEHTCVLQRVAVCCSVL